LAEVIDLSKLSGSKVVFGSTVTLIDVESEKEVTYKIVGEDEASIENGKVSNTSPIARALIGKEEGDEVEVAAPGGARGYEIAGVSYK
jgi:transcription elongation factor GreA